MKSKATAICRLAFLAAAVFAAATPCTAAPPTPPTITSLTGRAQGTTYHIKYWGDASPAPEKVQREVDIRLATFDREMSTYRDDSELSRFNRAPPNEWFPVSPDTAYVVEQALEFGRITDGILDVTVAPLLRLWHFGPGEKTPRDKLRPPTTEQLQQARKFVGLEHVRVRRDPPALWKDAAGVELDLSSLAPGYSVDLLIGLLHEHDLANAMVELGGEVRAVGTRPDGTPWRIGVERADPSDPGILRVLPLRNMASSTAGDYRNVRTEDGRRVTHIIDPRTGQALPYRGASVTIVAPTCLESDALDTPLLVMGSHEGYKWCVEHKVAAMFQEPAGSDDPHTNPSEDGVRITTTPRFDELIPKAELPEASK